MNRHQRDFVRALAKGWLFSQRNLWAGISNRPPGRGAARIDAAQPHYYSGNPQLRANLLHEANKEIVRYHRSFKSVARKLRTSTARPIGQTTVISSGAAGSPVGYGGSGYSGTPALTLGAAPTPGYQTVVRPSAPVGVSPPPYVNPPIQSNPASSVVRGASG
jgi:hypothetical protein